MYTNLILILLIIILVLYFFNKKYEKFNSVGINTVLNTQYESKNLAENYDLNNSVLIMDLASEKFLYFFNNKLIFDNNNKTIFNI